MKRICDLLAATPLFTGLTHDVFHHSCTRTNIQIYWKGQVIANEGDTCNGINLIIEGVAAMQKYAPSGEFTTLGLINRGNIFGEEMVFGTRRNYSCTIEAVTNCKVITVRREELLQMMSQSPLLLHNMLTMLSDRALLQEKRINLLSQKTLRAKICCYLLESLEDSWHNSGLSIEEMKKSVSTPAVELPVSKEVVARLLAMPRPSLSRELIAMENDGMIHVNGRVIWILNLDALTLGITESGGTI